MPLKSRPSYAMNSTVAPRVLAISVIRSMSRPVSAGIPLKGGSGKAAPTLSVFIYLPSLLEFCSGLVDLVVRIGHHGGGGHRFAGSTERFVSLLAENLP